MKPFDRVSGDVAPKTAEILLPQIQGLVSATACTAFMDLTIGYRYHDIKLLYGGTTNGVSHMTAIRVKANDEVIFNMSGSDLDTLNQFDKLAAAATYKVVTIPFERMGLKNQMRQYDTCINTGIPCAQAPHGILRFRLEIDFDSGTSAPTISGNAKVSPLNTDQSIFMPRTKTIYENVPGSATVEYLMNTKFVKNPDEPHLTRLMFNETAANLTNVRLSEEGVDTFSEATAIMEADTANAGIRAVNTSIVVLDSADRGNYGDYWEVGSLQNFDVRFIDANANAQLRIVAQTLGVLNKA